MKKVLGALVLVAAGTAAFLGLRARHRWANIVNEVSRTEKFLVPIDPAMLLAMRRALEKDGLAANVSTIKTQYTYLTVPVEGKSLVVRPAYTENNAPVGTLMSANPIGFFRSAAEDSKAEGVAINFEVPDARFSAILDKAGVFRMIESLKKRGLDKPQAAPPGR